MLNESHCLYETLTGRYDLAALLADNTDRYPFLLESTVLESSDTNHKASRFDILFAFPQQSLIKHSNNKVTYSSNRCAGDSFLDELDHIWDTEKINAKCAPSIPFSGGWFIYLGYELVDEIEPTIKLPEPKADQVIAYATRIPAAIVYDRIKDQTHIVVEQDYHDLLPILEADLKNSQQFADKPIGNIVEEIREENPHKYLDSVKTILDYIREGDVFQVNLSRHWQANLKHNIDAIDVYKKLRKANPAPFSAIATFEKFSIISSSPERLISVVGDKIETRPIAGTRPRDTNSNLDADLQTELITNDKERAEHIMLIDLERNDLGRICVPGSIQVDEFMVLESYAHVHHIVSNISGKLKKSNSP